MSSAESVKVAVRVRPFNQREKDRNAKLTIKMNGNTTFIINPENTSEKKSFAFDYSYWSHDGFKEDANGVLIPNSSSSNYASQRVVYSDLGEAVLKNAFDGYNCSLFAYGQTGSGKSYSMVGYGPNKGIVPVVCEELFTAISQKKTGKMRYEITFSMLEIYNENVRDLLVKEVAQKGGLPVRQSPLQGFYVQGLKKVPVGSYKEIESRMEQGTSNRTVAMTNMNATSSRAHTVVTLVFDQISKVSGNETKKSSTMNLVDLAGSERADSTGAVGDRLKEGANINKSLSVLGNVISALADLSMGKKKIIVPYRDSILTKLLQNALGGNSKTVMIAALSPADINYDETLSTLRYADRAKQIKNKAIVNENPVDKLLRELKEENDRLKKSLATGNLPQTVNTQGLSQEEIDKMRQELMEEIKANLNENNATITAEDPKNWDKMLEEARKETDEIVRVEKSAADKRNRIPHLINLNEDPQLSGVLVHYMFSKKILIIRDDAGNMNSSSDDDDDDDGNDGDGGQKKKRKRRSKSKKKSLNNQNDNEDCQKITLKGLSISNKHAIIERKQKDRFFMKPGLFGARTKVNGAQLTNEVQLNHRDRILFGSNHMYVFMNPVNTSTSTQNLPKVIDWEFAQSEIAHADGFETENVQGLTKDQQVVQQQILEIIPMVNEVNAIAEELKKNKRFHTILAPPNSQDAIYGSIKKTQLIIKVCDETNGNYWLWERGKFMNRRYMMQEIYHRYLQEGKSVLANMTPQNDPFWEPSENILVGTASVFLQALAYNLDFDDKIPILNYEGEEEGFINVTLNPSTANGRLLESDSQFVDDPKLLLTRTFHFLIGISKVELNNPRYQSGICVKFRIFKDEKSMETETIKDTNQPKFNYKKVHTFARINEEHLDYLENGFILFRIYANQEDKIPNLSHLKIGSITPNDGMGLNVPVVRRRLSVVPVPEPSEEASKYKSELAVLTKRLERLEKKDKRLKAICKDWIAKSNEEDRNYFGFFKAVNTIVFGGEVNKFRSTGRVVGHESDEEDNCDTFDHKLMLYTAQQAKSGNDNNLTSPNQNGHICASNPCLRDRDSSLENEKANFVARGESARPYQPNNTSKACILM